MYDTLEEFATCGYTFFPVREISERLRAKGKKGPRPSSSAAERRGRRRRRPHLGCADGSADAAPTPTGPPPPPPPPVTPHGSPAAAPPSKANEYEKEYLVRDSGGVEGAWSVSVSSAVEQEKI